MISIGLIEDNLHLSNTYKEFLEDFRDFKVIFSVQSMEEFELKHKHLKEPDVILLDIKLPGKSGIDGIEALKAVFPSTRIIILSSHDTSDSVFSSLKMGASSFVVKSSRLIELHDAIVDTITAGTHLSPAAANKLVERVQEKTGNSAIYQLTSREKMVVESLQNGHSYKEIASKLSVSVFTVNYHLKNIYKKLSVRSKSELMAKLYNDVI
jgi:DNA-binding NarL/FixJ family response regulator